MTPLSVTQTAAVLAVCWGILLWLYLRKPRLQRRIVSYLPAWEHLAPSRGKTRLQRPAVRRSWALVRALVLSALIALALAEPRLPGFTGIPTTTLLVLDVGAHMRATDETPTRFARAQELASGAVADRAATGDVMVAELDTALTPLSSFTRDERALRDAVAKARVGDAPTQLGAAAEFAIALLRERERAELLLVSDGAVSLDTSGLDRLRRAGIALTQLRVGTGADNLAIRSFAVRGLRWDAGRCEALFELENASARAQVVEVTLAVSGSPVDVARVRLDAHSRTRHIVALAATGREFSARVSAVGTPADVQPHDDVAYAVLSQPPPQRALLVTAGHRYLERALALDPRLTVERIAPNQYTSARGYDLAIFDQFVPSSAPEAPSFWLAPAVPNDRAGAPYRIAGSVDRPFFDRVSSDDALLRFVSLRDVNVRRASRAAVEPGDRVLAGTRESPLIVAGTRGRWPFVALTFDVRESDLVLRSAWPILLANVIAQLTSAQAPVDVPMRVGAAQTRPVEPRATTATLRGPSGQVRELPVRGGRVWIRPDEPGVHRLAAAGNEELIAVNPDPDANVDIKPRRIADPPTLAVSRQAPLLPWVPWSGLLAAALLVLALDVSVAYRWRP